MEFSLYLFYFKMVKLQAKIYINNFKTKSKKSKINKILKIKKPLKKVKIF